MLQKFCSCKKNDKYQVCDYIFWLHSGYNMTSNYIWTKFWRYFDYILATFLLHSGYNMTTFWIHSAYILAYTLTTFCLHSDYILTTFWLPSDITHICHSFYTGRIFENQILHQKKRQKAPRTLKMSLKKSNICIFFTQSGKIYTWQKIFTQTCLWCLWQIWGMFLSGVNFSRLSDEKMHIFDFFRDIFLCFWCL